LSPHGRTVRPSRRVVGAIWGCMPASRRLRLDAQLIEPRRARRWQLALPGRPPGEVTSASREKWHRAAARD
jgi:hypothetical protein